MMCLRLHAMVVVVVMVPTSHRQLHRTGAMTCKCVLRERAMPTQVATDTDRHERSVPTHRHAHHVPIMPDHVHARHAAGPMPQTSDLPGGAHPRSWHGLERRCSGAPCCIRAVGHCGRRAVHTL